MLGAESSSHEHWLLALRALGYQIFTAPYESRVSSPPHFTDTKTEAGRGEVTCLRSKR